jgi:2-hydroxy-6-oxonona-2,4-dienedioate hydrolase
VTRIHIRSENRKGLVFMADDPAQRVAALDAESRRVETPCGEGRMVWRVWGDGPAVLLLHGGHGSWTHWIRNIRPLAAHFTVVAPDMPGYAESDAVPESPPSADGLARVMVAGLPQVIGTAPCAVVGFSFGGVVGGHVAKYDPQRVTRLVLVGSGGLGLPRPKLDDMANWRLMKSPEDRMAAHRRNLGILMLHDRSKIDDLAVHLQSQNTARTRVNSRAISRTDALRQSLATFGAPLSAIWGVHDATTGAYLDGREELLRSFDRDAEFIRLDAGHWAPFEAPDAFNPALIALLTAPPRRRAA